MESEPTVLWFFLQVRPSLAAKAGAAYVSPFIGRIDDTGMGWIDID